MFAKTELTVSNILKKNNRENFKLKLYQELEEFFSYLQKYFKFEIDEDSVLSAYDLIKDNRITYQNIKESLALHQAFKLGPVELDLNQYIHFLIKNPDDAFNRFEEKSCEFVKNKSNFSENFFPSDANDIIRKNLGEYCKMLNSLAESSIDKGMLLKETV